MHNWKHKETSTQRGYGYQWQQLRLRVLARDDRLCQECLRHDRITPANQVDHITPKAKGGTDDADNLQTLCDECHKAKTQREQGSKPKITYGIDGQPAEVSHSWNQ